MRPLILLCTLVACSSDPKPGHQQDPTPTDGTTPSTPSSGTPAGTPTTGTTATGTPTTPSTDPCADPDVVQFVALGDAGTGSPDQYAVADAIEQVCAERCCDFALYLGDNFYDTGVDGADDDLFVEYFEAPYANLDFPFMVTLGNHDYGALGLGIEFWKGNYYLDYSAENPTSKFEFPELFYSYQTSNVKFLALNTTELFFGLTGEQGNWVDQELDNLDAAVEWVIAFGHHPYISNGQHGNAGAYEGLPFIPIASGDAIRDFFDDHLCGRVQVYICGHDHNRQMLVPTCGTEFIVSGAGAKTTDLEGRGNDTFFEDDTTEGFVWVEIRGNEFTAAFYDKTATLNYEQTFTP